MGFPAAPGADARALRRCVVSARRVPGSAVLRESLPFLLGFAPSLLGGDGAGGALGREWPGLLSWASPSASSGLQGLQFAERGVGKVWGHKGLERLREEVNYW